MAAPRVTVSGLSKSYRVYARPIDRLLELTLGRQRHTRFHALKSVSFEMPAGESLGIIGENGAGKSTLLKILAGVTVQTSGEIEVRGQVASILELGSAFHPEFTGRQNILLNAAMLGLSRDEVTERTPDIIAFSELGEFIDQPLKCYSTGMVMRLAFAIATQVNPDVLIVDEALSVGDGYFQRKCMHRLREFAEDGGSILLCSHAMYYVSAFCHRALWLGHGEVVALGSTDEVVREYETFLLAKSGDSAEAPPQPGAARVVDVSLPRGELYRYGEPWEIAVAWETDDPTLGFHLGIGVNRADGVEVCAFLSHRDGLDPWAGSRNHRARVMVPELPLVKGTFTLYVYLVGDDGLHIHDLRIIERAFSVESREYQFGIVQTPHSWQRDGEGAVQIPGESALDGSQRRVSEERR
jgi:lipopolysaccharide transport system ATP-binding protein